jgi:outer membrane protein assembly factor BamB
VPNAALGIAIAADGTLYVCTGGTLTGIGADGSSKWQVNVGCANTPAIGADGTIYVGGTNVLTALTPPMGVLAPTTKWTFPTASGTVSSPNIGGDGTIYVTVANLIYAVTSSGTQRWSYTTSGSISGMVALGPSGTVYAVADSLYALGATGNLKWRALSDAGVGGLSSYAPVVGQNESVLIAGDIDIMALSSSGALLWDTSIIGAPWASPSVAPDGTVFGVANGGTFAAMNPSTGVKKWTFTASGTILTQATVDSSGSAYFSDNSNDLYALTLTGTLLFSSPVGVFPAPVLGNGRVLYLPTGGAIIQYTP